MHADQQVCNSSSDSLMMQRSAHHGAAKLLPFNSHASQVCRLDLSIAGPVQAPEQDPPEVCCQCNACNTHAVQKHQQSSPLVPTCVSKRWPSCSSLLLVTLLPLMPASALASWPSSCCSCCSYVLSLVFSCCSSFLATSVWLCAVVL